MASKKKKGSRSIASRSEKISSRKKKPRSVAERIADTQKLSRSFKEAAGAVGAVVGPGKFAKGFKTIKQAADAVRINKAKRKAEILAKKQARAKAARSTKGIRLPVQGRPKPTEAQEAIKKKMDDFFSKENIAKRSAADKQARETKAAAQKLTRKRKAQQKRIDKKK